MSLPPRYVWSLDAPSWCIMYTCFSKYCWPMLMYSSLSTQNYHNIIQKHGLALFYTSRKDTREIWHGIIRIPIPIKFTKKFVCFTLKYIDFPSTINICINFDGKFFKVYNYIRTNNISFSCVLYLMYSHFSLDGIIEK